MTRLISMELICRICCFPDAQPFLFQLKTVLARSSLACYRNADYQFTRLFNHISISLIVGLTFLQVGNGAADLQYRVFSIFIVGVLPILVSSPPVFLYWSAWCTHLTDFKTDNSTSRADVHHVKDDFYAGGFLKNLQPTGLCYCPIPSRDSLLATLCHCIFYNLVLYHWFRLLI
jgi:hypothetical protein